MAPRSGLDRGIAQTRVVAARLLLAKPVVVAEAVKRPLSGPKGTGRGPTLDGPRKMRDRDFDVLFHGGDGRGDLRPGPERDRAEGDNLRHTADFRWITLQPQQAGLSHPDILAWRQRRGRQRPPGTVGHGAPLPRAATNAKGQLPATVSLSTAIKDGMPLRTVCASPSACRARGRIGDQPGGVLECGNGIRRQLGCLQHLDAVLDVGGDGLQLLGIVAPAWHRQRRQTRCARSRAHSTP